MIRFVCFTCLLLLLALGSAFAQDGAQDLKNGRSAAPAPEHLLNAPYLAPTGATVPHPGASQSGGNTALDRGINREDDKITHGICSNC